MPPRSHRPRIRRPSRLLPWVLAGAATAALAVVAVTAWRAADSQRRDGEAALRGAAAEAATRAAESLDSSFAMVVALQRQGFPINPDWFKTPGMADDWIFGPWPQPENDLSRALDAVRTLRLEGKPEEALLAFTTPGNPLHGLTNFQTFPTASPAWNSHTPVVRVPQPPLSPEITTPAGIPLGPLLIREQLLCNVKFRRELAGQLLYAAVACPSLLTPALIDEAAAVLAKETTEDEALALATARREAAELEALRAFLQSHAGPKYRGGRWLDERWYDFGGRAIPRREIQLLTPTTLANNAGGPLQSGWSFRTLLEGIPVQQPGRPALHPMAVATSGRWRVEVVSHAAAPFAALQSQLVRQRWLIGGATSFMAASLLGFMAVLGRQRRLNAMMSNFVASVSHELRAPIGSIGLLAERLGTGRIADAVEQFRYHQLIRGECRRLSGTIENVLSFSRLERGRTAQEQELSDLPALVRDTADLLRPLAEERGVTLLTTLPAAPLECEIDPASIRQAVLNLIDNALKFSPPGGTIRLALTQITDEAIITVSDEGPGVPEAERVRIFEPFYRIGNELRRETPGIGIGLAIVRHAALTHGGGVTVKDRTERTAGFSQNGTGAVFELRMQKTPPLKPRLNPEP